MQEERPKVADTDSRQGGTGSRIPQRKVVIQPVRSQEDAPRAMSPTTRITGRKEPSKLDAEPSTGRRSQSAGGLRRGSPEVPVRTTPVMLRRVEPKVPQITSQQRTDLSWDEFLEELDALERAAASASQPSSSASSPAQSPYLVKKRTGGGEGTAGDTSTSAQDSDTSSRTTDPDQLHLHNRSASYPARLDRVSQPPTPRARESTASSVSARSQDASPRATPRDSTHLDVMVEVGARASAGSQAAKEFYDAFGKLDGARERSSSSRGGGGRGAAAATAATAGPEFARREAPPRRLRPSPLTTRPGSSSQEAQPDGTCEEQAAPATASGSLDPPAAMVAELRPVLDDAALLAEAERRLPAVMAELRRGIESGLCTGAQLSMRLRGEAPMHMWAGEVRKGVPMRRDMLCNWMSTTKPVAVIAIAQLWERNLLGLSEPVAKYIPEFGCNGKQGILLEHLLTHTAGIPYADVSMWTCMHEWDRVVSAICDASIEPGWQPGTRAGYHPYSAWFVLGELVRRLDGRPFAQYARDEIFLPLGMVDCYVGMSAAEYEPYAAAGRFAELRTLAPGGRVVGKSSQGMAANEVMACVPGANGRGPAEQWLRLFQMLVDEGVGADGTRLLQPATVRGLSKRYRVGMYDEVQGVVCDWSLGLSVGSTLSGAHASPDTFGHGGSQSSMGFCDPQHKLAVVVVTNARPGPKLHYERMHRLATQLYEDLGLAPTTPRTPAQGGARGGPGPSIGAGQRPSRGPSLDSSACPVRTPKNG